jgi:tripartite-type tricarboxylate transporter receptor subunit TctC
MKEKRWMMGRKVFLCGIFLFLIPALSTAQQYPTKPITISIGFNPGANVDQCVRAAAAAAEKHLGRPFILVNKGGGGGSIALGIVAKERPDGYHLVGTSTSGFIYTPHIRSVPYTIEDFVFISTFAESNHVGLMVRSDSPWKTFKEFIEYAKKNPGAVTYSSPGAGGAHHLAMEVIGKKEGIQWTSVPNRSAIESFMALLGGHVTADSGSPTDNQEHVKAGKARILVMYNDTRSPIFPEIPTLKELGYDYSSEIFFLAAAPKGTPPAIVKKLEEAYRKGIDDPEYIQALKNTDNAIVYRNSEDTKKYLEEAYARKGKLIRELNIPKESEK